MVECSPHVQVIAGSNPRHGRPDSTIDVYGFPGKLPLQIPTISPTDGYMEVVYNWSPLFSPAFLSIIYYLCRFC